MYIHQRKTGLDIWGNLKLRYNTTENIQGLQKSGKRILQFHIFTGIFQCFHQPSTNHRKEAHISIAQKRAKNNFIFYNFILCILFPVSSFISLHLKVSKHIKYIPLLNISVLRLQKNWHLTVTTLKYIDPNYFYPTNFSFWRLSLGINTFLKYSHCANKGKKVAAVDLKRKTMEELNKWRMTGKSPPSSILSAEFGRLVEEVFGHCLHHIHNVIFICRKTTAHDKSAIFTELKT